MKKTRRRGRKGRPAVAPYIRRLEMMHRAGLFSAGGVTLVDVKHDDHCGIWKGRNCGCAFELVLKPVKPKAPPKEHAR